MNLDIPIDLGLLEILLKTLYLDRSKIVPLYVDFKSSFIHLSVKLHFTVEILIIVHMIFLMP